MKSMSAIPTGTSEKIEDIIKATDTNGNGKIERVEYIQMMG